MKFIVFMSDFDATKSLFRDLEKLSYVKCLSSIIPNIYIRKLYSLFRARLNIKKYSRFWRLFTFKEHCNEDLVFLYLGTNSFNLAIDLKYIDYCKKRYPSCKHVLYFADIHVARKCNIEKIKSDIDYIYIFDDIEAKKLNIDYYPLPYSKFESLIDNKSNKTDIYWVGQAKSRFKELIKIFEFCEKNNIVTDFNIVGIAKNEQLYSDKINYIDFISYEETLKVASRSNCGLELLVEGVTSYSQRVAEALVNNKKLISNNPNIKNAPFYNEESIMIFEKIKEVPPKFIIEKTINNYDYGDEFSPIKFLDFIKKKIGKEDEYE